VKILITGAGGFVGSYLSRHLPEHDVHAFTKADLNLTNSTDVHNCLNARRYDAIIHCAARGRNNVRDVDQDIITDNLLAWANLHDQRAHFGKLINIASGAEFDIQTNIKNADELDIWQRSPAYSYGLSKNFIARSAQETDNFYNLRLFGCFDPSEDNRRPLKRLTEHLSNGQEFIVSDDRLFDMVSAADLTTVIKAVLDDKIQDCDLNVVYTQKHKLSDILKMYARKNQFNEDLITVATSDLNNYTGSSSRLDKYNLPLEGLEVALQNYNRRAY
jgi:GDP-L-fucose synthase